MTIKDVAENLKKFNTFLIFSHVRPDGDTLGSAFALKRALESLGKKADIICQDEVPEKFAFLPISKSVKKLSEITEKYQAHVAVDCSVESMHGENFYLFLKCNNTFNIDHHVSNSKYAKINYVKETSSCCEIVFQLIKDLGVKYDKEIANLVLLGILTDTGAFAHNNVKDSTLSIASELLSYGADLSELYRRMFKSQSKERAMLHSYVMSKMKFFHDGKLAIISIFKDDLKKFSATKDLTEGFIDFPLSIDGVEVAISILEYGDKSFKISYRSKGTVNVNSVAATFGGGGHVLASGSMLSGYYDDVVDKLVFTVGNYL